MIKEIKTEKFSGKALLVPDDAYNFRYYPIDWQSDVNVIEWDIPAKKTGSLVETNGHYLIEDDFDYEILGRATELNEEQCEAIGYENPIFHTISFRTNLSWLILKKI
jgi:hypothetical protein